MKTSLPVSVLAQLSQFLAAHMGLHFPPERWNDLQRGLAAAAEEFKFADAMECANWLMSAPLNRRQVEVLASTLTVGETYFFREKRSFELLQTEILPELLLARRGVDQRLRIWSAACCTGEEPYSIAMTLRQTLADIADWNVTIVATDINPHFLQKAAEGVYGEWSFRETQAWIRDKYFRKMGQGRWELLPEVKEMVDFSYLNLAEDVFPSLQNNTNAMDVIFCRNVLMYFAPEQAERVIRGFHHALLDGGWLLVSPSELSHVHKSPFAAVTFPGAILFKKDFQGQAVQSSTVPPAFAPEPMAFAPVPTPEPAIPRQAKIASSSVEPPKRPSLTPYEQALACYEQGLYTEAANLLAGQTKDTMPPQAVALLARAYANQGKLTEALGACERAIVAERVSPIYHYLRATILQEQGSDDEAISSLKRALYLDPRFVLAHFALGNLVRGRGRETEARKHFANAAKLLSSSRPGDTVPESDGLTAGRLAAIIASMTNEEVAL